MGRNWCSSARLRSAGLLLSLAACAAVANAELLAGLVVHQLGKPGAPFVMGVGIGTMNMQYAVEVIEFMLEDSS
jgi:trimethylamine:corrinoid methyltransferase-like protein